MGGLSRCLSSSAMKALASCTRGLDGHERMGSSTSSSTFAVAWSRQGCTASAVVAVVEVGVGVGVGVVAMVVFSVVVFLGSVAWAAPVLACACLPWPCGGGCC